MMFVRNNLHFESSSPTAAIVNKSDHVSSTLSAISPTNNHGSNSRVNRSCQRTILFNQPLRRFIIALVTLRLTSTSTSTATTITSSAIGSLATLIKSLLISCYYLLVFTSLLLLILYINHVTSQSGNIHLDMVRMADPILKPTSLLGTAAMLAGRQVTASGQAGRLRLKRAATFDSKGNQTKFAHLQPARRIKQLSEKRQSAATRSAASKSGAGLRRPPVGQTSRAAGNNKLPELSERQAGSASRTPTGAPHSRAHLLADESQWRPISPVRVESSRSLSSSRQYNSGGDHSHQPPVAGLMADAPSHRQATRRHPPHADQFQQARQWRRPRLNPVMSQDVRPFTIQASKMYKRVLLCDKTLVSLDYIKNIDLESRPYNVPTTPYGNQVNFDDNVIDLENDLENLFPDRRSGLINITGGGESPAASASRRNDLVAYEVNSVNERRSYLSEQDPLVRCDMWDLEKGIKNRKPPIEILSMAVKADFDTVRDAINRCRQLSERTLPSEDELRDDFDVMSAEDLLSLFSMKRGLIPGTKWCGLGDQASSYNDLGSKHRIDICCRAHDHCPIRLKPFRNDYGVLNIALYTKSHCDCDADFYRCLREVHSRTADMLGNLYFNVMKLQCMREERMKVCREMKPIALGFERCVRYEDSPVKTVFRFTTPLVAY